MPSGITKLAWPRPPSSGSTEATIDVGVGDAAVGDPGLGPVEHPLVGGLVVDRAGAQARDVAAGVGLRDAEGAELDVVGGPEALRDPLHLLLGGAVGHDPGDRQGRAHDRQADPGVAPGELLEGQHHLEPQRIAEGVGHEVEAVEADLGRLLDDRPRRLLALVPLVGDGSDGFSAKSCTHFCSVSWSSLSSSEKSGMRSSVSIGRVRQSCYRRSNNPARDDRSALRPDGRSAVPSALSSTIQPEPRAGRGSRRPERSPARGRAGSRSAASARASSHRPRPPARRVRAPCAASEQATVRPSCAPRRHRRRRAPCSPRATQVEDQARRLGGLQVVVHQRRRSGPTADLVELGRAPAHHGAPSRGGARAAEPARRGARGARSASAIVSVVTSMGAR